MTTTAPSKMVTAAPTTTKTLAQAKAELAAQQAAAAKAAAAQQAAAAAAAPKVTFSSSFLLPDPNATIKQIMSDAKNAPSTMKTDPKTGAQYQLIPTSPTTASWYVIPAGSSIANLVKNPTSNPSMDSSSTIIASTINKKQTDFFAQNQTALAKQTAAQEQAAAQAAQAAKDAAAAQAAKAKAEADAAAKAKADAAAAQAAQAAAAAKAAADAKAAENQKLLDAVKNAKTATELNNAKVYAQRAGLSVDQSLIDQANANIKAAADKAAAEQAAATAKTTAITNAGNTLQQQIASGKVTQDQIDAYNKAVTDAGGTPQSALISRAQQSIQYQADTAKVAQQQQFQNQLTDAANKGTLTPKMVQDIADQARAAGVPLTDSTLQNFSSRAQTNLNSQFNTQLSQVKTQADVDRILADAKAAGATVDPGYVKQAQTLVTQQAARDAEAAQVAAQKTAAEQTQKDFQAKLPDPSTLPNGTSIAGPNGTTYYLTPTDLKTGEPGHWVFSDENSVSHDLTTGKTMTMSEYNKQLLETQQSNSLIQQQQAAEKAAAEAAARRAEQQQGAFTQAQTIGSDAFKKLTLDSTVNAKDLDPGVLNMYGADINRITKNGTIPMQMKDPTAPGYITPQELAGYYRAGDTFAAQRQDVLSAAAQLQPPTGFTQQLGPGGWMMQGVPDDPTTKENEGGWYVQMPSGYQKVDSEGKLTGPVMPTLGDFNKFTDTIQTNKTAYQQQQDEAQRALAATTLAKDVKSFEAALPSPAEMIKSGKSILRGPDGSEYSLTPANLATGQGQQWIKIDQNMKGVTNVATGQTQSVQDYNKAYAAVQAANNQVYLDQRNAMIAAQQAARDAGPFDGFFDSPIGKLFAIAAIGSVLGPAISSAFSGAGAAEAAATAAELASSGASAGEIAAALEAAGVPAAAAATASEAAAGIAAGTVDAIATAATTGITPEMLAAANATLDPIAALNAAAGWTAADTAYLASIGAAPSLIATAEANNVAMGFPASGAETVPAEAVQAAAPQPVTPETVAQPVAPSAPGPAPVDTSKMIPTVDAAGNPGYFDPATGQVVNESGQVVSQTTMPEVGPGVQTAEAPVRIELRGMAVPDVPPTGPIPENVNPYVAGGGGEYAIPEVAPGGEPLSAVAPVSVESSAGALPEALGGTAAAGAGLGAGGAGAVAPELAAGATSAINPVTGLLETVTPAATAGGVASVVLSPVEAAVAASGLTAAEVAALGGTAAAAATIAGSGAAGAKAAADAAISSGTAAGGGAAGGTTTVGPATPGGGAEGIPGGSMQAPATPAAPTGVEGGTAAAPTGTGVAGPAAPTSVTTNPATGLTEVVTPATPTTSTVTTYGPGGEVVSQTTITNPGVAGVDITGTGVGGGDLSGGAATAGIIGAGTVAGAGGTGAAATGGTTGAVAGPVTPGTTPTTPLTPPTQEVIPPGSSTVTPTEIIPPGSSTVTPVEATTPVETPPGGGISPWWLLPAILPLLPNVPQPGMPSYGPLPPTEWGKVGKVNIGGLQPGFITNVPAQYQTQNMQQSKFYWGQHPMQPGPTFDPNLYRQVPAPAQAWGLQQMYTPMNINQYVAQQQAINAAKAAPAPVPGPVIPT